MRVLIYCVLWVLFGYFLRLNGMYPRNRPKSVFNSPRKNNYRTDTRKSQPMAKRVFLAPGSNTLNGITSLQ